jgi:hypothetical protein
MSNESHPYASYEQLKLWELVSQGLDDLEINGDIELKTTRPHAVGYLCKVLVDAKVLAESNPKLSS